MPTLNCDLGELPDTWQSGKDKALLAYLDEVNISCGAHAGSPWLIKETIALSVEKGLKIGAHPAYFDTLNFGRIPQILTKEAVSDMVLRQLNSFAEWCDELKVKISHVKAHGALYNQAATEEHVAQGIVDAILRFDKTLKVFGLPNSCLQNVAKAHGLTFVAEAFADRRYAADGNLLSRQLPGAVIENPEDCLTQVKQICENKCLRSVENELVYIDPGTMCIHGDHHNVLAVAQKVSYYLSTL